MMVMRNEITIRYYVRATNVKDIYEMQTDRVQLDVFEYQVCF